MPGTRPPPWRPCPLVTWQVQRVSPRRLPAMAAPGAFDARCAHPWPHHPPNLSPRAPLRLALPLPARALGLTPAPPFAPSSPAHLPPATSSPPPSGTTSPPTATASATAPTAGSPPRRQTHPGRAPSREPPCLTATRTRVQDTPTRRVLLRWRHAPGVWVRARGGGRAVRAWRLPVSLEIRRPSPACAAHAAHPVRLPARPGPDTPCICPTPRVSNLPRRTAQPQRRLGVPGEARGPSASW